MKRGPPEHRGEKNGKKYHVEKSRDQSEMNRAHSRAPSSHVLVEMDGGIYHDLNLSPVVNSGVASW